MLNAKAADHSRFIPILTTATTLVLPLAMLTHGETLQFRCPRHPYVALVLAVIFVLGRKLERAEMWPETLLRGRKLLVTV